MGYALDPSLVPTQEGSPERAKALADLMDTTHQMNLLAPQRRLYGGGFGAAATTCAHCGGDVQTPRCQSCGAPRTRGR